MRKISTWGYISEPLTPLICVMGFDTLLPAFRVFRLAVLPPLSFGHFPRGPGETRHWSVLSIPRERMRYHHVQSELN